MEPKSCLLFSGFLLFSLCGDAYCRGLQEAEGHQHGCQAVPTPWLKQVTSVVSHTVLLSPPDDSKSYYIPVAQSICPTGAVVQVSKAQNT